MRDLSRWMRGVGLLLASLVFSSACYAQSCSLCYTQAASSGKRMIQGLRSGILVLIIPPMFMSVGITILAYRKRNRIRQDPPGESSSDKW
jgi:hypothetical protein